MLSMLKGHTPVAALAWPAPSVAVAVKLWLPVFKGLVGVQLQVPSPATVVLPMGVVPPLS